MGSVDAVIKANWGINTYSITYELNGGINTSDNPTNGTYGTTLNISNLTKEGYTFTNWTVSGTVASLSDNKFTIGAGNVTLIANWKVATPVGAYSCANGSSGSSYFFTYTGNCSVIDDGNGSWRVKFLTSGTFKSTNNLYIDVFLVGGGRSDGGGRGANSDGSVGGSGTANTGGGGGGSDDSA